VSEFVEQVRAVLQAGPPRWSALVAHVPNDLLARAPAPGEWSALSCLQHLVDLDDAIFAGRARSILAGEPFAAFDPAGDHAAHPIADGPTLVREFEEERARTLLVLDRITDADLERTGHHDKLGELSLRAHLSEWAGHDLMHMVQAERAIMQPFILQSGVMRGFFRDHDVEAT